MGYIFIQYFIEITVTNYITKQINPSRRILIEKLTVH